MANNLAVLTSNIELLIGHMADDFIVFDTFLIMSPFEKWISKLKELITTNALKVVRYAGIYNNFTENFRFFCFIANCNKNYKKILCIFTTSVYGISFR